MIFFSIFFIIILFMILFIFVLFIILVIFFIINIINFYILFISKLRDKNNYKNWQNTIPKYFKGIKYNNI